MEFYIKQRKEAKDKETGELKDPDYNEDSYRADCGEKKQPRGFPKQNVPGKWCKKEPINIDDARKELEEVKE